MSVNSFKEHVKLLFFGGNSLKPVPPKPVPFARAIDLHSDDDLDEKQVKAWLKQAKKLPGWGRL